MSGSPPTATRIAPESACTSVQLHLQVAPSEFAAHWNAAQALSAPQVALGRQLAVLLRQAAARRDPHRAVQAGHRHPAGRAEEPGRAPPRVLRRALDHLDLRPVRGERPLLPDAAAPRPATRTRWRRSRPAIAPELSELRLHNGTVYRWNRPIYDIVGGTPAPAGREPRAARRPDHRRRARQRGVLLRRDPDAGPRGPPGLDQDELRRVRGELPPGARDGIDAAPLLARLRRAVGRRAGPAPPAAAGPRGAAPVGRLGCRARALPRRHRGPLQDRA